MRSFPGNPGTGPGGRDARGTPQAISGQLLGRERLHARYFVQSVPVTKYRRK